GWSSPGGRERRRMGPSAAVRATSRAPRVPGGGGATRAAGANGTLLGPGGPRPRGGIVNPLLENVAGLLDLSRRAVTERERDVRSGPRDFAGAEGSGRGRRDAG